MKKAAMFGLDARIALAIFGALSVISGAALYSAIQTSKATAMLADLTELSKAYEQYLLDTGSELPSFDIINHNGAVLVNNSIVPASNWNGPYLPYSTTKWGISSAPYDLFLDYSYKYDNSALYFTRLKSGDWPAGITGDNILTLGGTGAKCVIGNCSMYAAIRSTTIPYDLLESIDIIVDGVSDNEKGNFKYVKFSTASSYSYLKIRPVSDASNGTVVL